MRKKQLAIFLEDAENQIQHLLKEKEELITKLNKAQEVIENNEEMANKDAVIDTLNATINELKTTNETMEQNYTSKINELNSTIEGLNKQINDSKGELFDAKKNIDELKIRIEYLTQYANSNVTATPNLEETEIPETEEKPAPQIKKIEKIEELHKEAYEYGSKIISQAIIKCSNIKNEIVNTAGPITEELLTLCLGKVEMLKTGVLQFIMEDISYDEKCIKMDLILKETYDYFESLLGQIK